MLRGNVRSDFFYSFYAITESTQGQEFNSGQQDRKRGFPLLPGPPFLFSKYLGANIFFDLLLLAHYYYLAQLARTTGRLSRTAKATTTYLVLSPFQGYKGKLLLWSKEGVESVVVFWNCSEDRCSFTIFTLILGVLMTQTVWIEKMYNHHQCF